MTADDIAEKEVNAVPSRLTLNWRDIAFVGLSLAAGSMIALIIVVAIGRPDILSTVALTLAIVSFGVQFAAYASASSDASRQLERSMEIYADTRSLLARIEQTTALTHDGLMQQNESLLQSLIAELKAGAAKTEQAAQMGSSEGPSASALVDSFAQRLEEQFARASSTESPVNERVAWKTRDEPARGGNNARARKGNARMIELLQSWPHERELEDAIDTFTTLSEAERDALGSLAAVELGRRREGKTDLIGAWHSDSEAEAEDDAERDIEPLTDPTGPHGLLDRGLARTIPTPTFFKAAEAPGEHWVSLTPAGRKVARIVTAVGPPPAEVPQELNELRDRVDAHIRSAFG